MALRASLLRWHRWIGAVIAVLLLSQGLTGAAMVFREELGRALHHSALTVAPAPSILHVQVLLDEVRKAHPTLHVTRIDYPKTISDAYVFRMEAGEGRELRFLSVDPYRGVITRDEPLQAWPVQLLFEIHQELLAGSTGEIVVGLVGVSLLFMAVTGPIVWWPGRRGLKRGLKVNLHAGAYRGARDLHRVGGIFVAVVLFFSAVTGILVVWKTPIQSALSHFMPLVSRPSPKVSERADAAFLPVDDVVKTARTGYGNALVKSVRYPGGQGRVVIVYFEAAGTTRPRATDQIWINGYTGEVLGTYDAMALPAANRFMDWMLPIHTGTPLGLFGRILFLLAALTLAGLSITGLIQWYKRQQMRRSHTVRAGSIAS